MTLTWLKTDKSKAKFVYVIVHSTYSYLSFYYVQGTSLNSVDMTENKTEKISCFLESIYTLEGGRQTISKINKLNLQFLEDNKSKGKNKSG